MWPSSRPALTGSCLSHVEDPRAGRSTPGGFSQELILTWLSYWLMHSINLTLEKLIFSKESNYFPHSQDKVIYFPCSFDSLLEMWILALKYEAVQPQAAIRRTQHISPYLQDDPTPAPLPYSHRLEASIFYWTLIVWTGWPSLCL